MKIRRANASELFEVMCIKTIRTSLAGEQLLGRLITQSGQRLIAIYRRTEATAKSGQWFKFDRLTVTEFAEHFEKHAFIPTMRVPVIPADMKIVNLVKDYGNIKAPQKVGAVQSDSFWTIYVKSKTQWKLTANANLEDYLHHFQEL